MEQLWYRCGMGKKSGIGIVNLLLIVAMALGAAFAIWRVFPYF